MKKKSKKATEERFFDELVFRAKRARLSSSFSDFAFIGGWPKKKASRERILKGIEESKKADGSFDLGNLFIISAEADKMVKKTYEDKKGFFHIKINPEAPREIIHWLIDNILDSFPRHIMDFLREAGRKGLTNGEVTRILKEKYDYPKPKQRFRREQIEALKVWEERRLRKPYRQIAKELGIKESTARKRFGRAYELLFNKKYDPADFEKPEVKKEYLKRVCTTCNERPTCKELCPDVIAFIEQDTESQIRQLLGEVEAFTDPNGEKPPATGTGQRIMGLIKYKEEHE
jgi:hypothetical protein